MTVPQPGPAGAERNTIRLTERLSIRQAQFTVLIAFALGFVLSFSQIYVDFQASRESVSNTISQVLQSVRRPATSAILNLDEDVGREILLGLFEYRSIRKAVISDENGHELVALERELETGRLRWITSLIFGQTQIYDIALDTNQLAGDDSAVFRELFGTGSLAVTVDTYYVASDFLDRALLIIVSGVIKNLVLALSLLWFYHAFLTRPFLNLQDNLVRIDPQEPGNHRLAPPHGHHHDEFGLLVRTVNDLLRTITARTADKIRQAKQTERLEVELREQERREREQLAYQQEIESANEELQTTMEELQTTMEELTNSNETLESTVDELRATQKLLVEAEKMSALGQLVAGVAHEINTPLGVGVTASSHLQQQTETIRAKYDGHTVTQKDFERYMLAAQHSADIIQRNLQRAADLTHSFKQVAVDQSGEAQRVFLLREYLLDVLESLGPQLKRTHISIQVAGLEDQDVEWDGYPGAFSQVVTNLVMNSIAHGFERSQSGTVKIELGVIGNEFHFIYSDNGRGIAPDAQKKVFEPFYTTNRKGGGSGLGMHLVYNIIVQKFHGTITLHSEPGEGVTFAMSWPLAPVSGGSQHLTP